MPPISCSTLRTRHPRASVGEAPTGAPALQCMFRCHRVHDVSIQLRVLACATVMRCIPKIEIVHVPGSRAIASKSTKRARGSMRGSDCVLARELCMLMPCAIRDRLMQPVSQSTPDAPGMVRL